MNVSRHRRLIILSTDKSPSHTFVHVPCIWEQGEGTGGGGGVSGGGSRSSNGRNSMGTGAITPNPKLKSLANDNYYNQINN